MDAPLQFFHVFTDTAHRGNPAACALFSAWPAQDVLQRMAYQAQQPVSAFLVPFDEHLAQYQIRWFSCQQEINLCGHGTLAAAALLRQLKGEGSYHFLSQHGNLRVVATANSLQMQLPQWHGSDVQLAPAWQAYKVVDCFQTRDLVLVLSDEQEVRRFQPDFALIRQLPQHALIITAFKTPDTYVLRYFAPAIGLDEDIATGSAQCSLAPYWAEKTGLQHFQVQQVSALPASFSVSIHASQLYLNTQAICGQAQSRA